MRGTVRTTAWVVASVSALGALAITAACGSDYSVPNTGQEGGACYPNQTCDPGLTCASSLCVKLGADAGAPARDAGGGLATDAGANDGSPSFDGGGPTDATTDGGLLCPGPVDTSKLPAWKAAVAMLGSCGTADLQAVAALAPDANAYDVYPKLSASCRSCMFSNQADPSWQVVVGLPNMAADFGFVNVGGCVQIAGSNTVCGGAFGDYLVCDTYACPKGCPATCGMSPDIMNDLCASQYGNIVTRCTTATASQLQMKCQTLSQITNVICGSGP